MTIKAQVKLYGQRVGTLEKAGDHYRFCYLPDYAGPALSLSLPLTAKPYRSTQLHPFFASLAAEGWLKRQMCRSQGLSADDTFSLLINNGDDLIGAVQIVGEPTNEK